MFTVPYSPKHAEDREDGEGEEYRRAAEEGGAAFEHEHIDEKIRPVPMVAEPNADGIQGEREVGVKRGKEGKEGNESGKWSDEAVQCDVSCGRTGVCALRAQWTPCAHHLAFPR